MGNYKVYEHLFPNGKRYIGITRVSTNERWEKNGNGYKTQTVFKSIQKYGWDNIEHNILFDNLTYEDACMKEKELIAKYKTMDKRYGYNNTSGGDAGHIVSEQARENMSKAQKGRPCSENTKRVNREKRLGKPRPINEIVKTAEKLRGRKIGMSDLRLKRIKEGIANMSEEKRKQWRENVAKGLKTATYKDRCGKEILQIDIETNEIVGRYLSLKEMSRKTGFNRGYIGRICNGTYRKDTDIACGFRWKLGNIGNYRVPNSKHYKGR